MKTLNLIILLFLLLFSLLLSKEESLYLNIPIIYIIDSFSFQYFILSVTSITKYHNITSSSSLSSSLSKIYQLEIYIIITGKNINEINEINNKIINYFKCYKLLKYFIYYYENNKHQTHLNMLENILKNNNDNKENKNKKNVPHWLSTTEKLRNYIPEIIPSLNRFIYFDNDIIITKENILYDLWNYNIGDSPLGLVGNALHPAEYDIINNFYDLDDPFIQKSFHFYPNITHPTLTKKILQTILPIYPNNGVMLVNATKWRELNISSTAR